jgi:hypothetical protein
MDDFPPSLNSPYVIIASGPVYLSLQEQIDGQYVESYDPEAFDGRGDAKFTRDRNRAKMFATHADAWAFWMQVPKSRPLRADGKANRPLTCFTITVEPLRKIADPVVVVVNPHGE